MNEYPKIIRLPVKPREERSIMKETERRVGELKREIPANPFVSVAPLLEKQYAEVVRRKRERTCGFVLDNSHRRQEK